MLPKLSSRARIAMLLLVALVLTALPAAPAVAATAFIAAPAPTITGSTTVGATLTANPGTWNPVPTFKYQWKRGTTVITGATARTYTPVATDVGKTVTVTVTGTKTGYTTTSKTSAPTAAIKTPAAFIAAPAPTITGSTTVGATLTANPGTWNPVPDRFGYQWKRGSTAITGATESTYKPVTADVGATLTVTVTGTKTGYTTTSRTSAETAAIAAAPDVPFTMAPIPIVTGTTTVGSTLTATTGTWNPAPTTFTYHWKRGTTEVEGATEDTYTLVAADAGKTLTVTVTGERTGYATTSRTSTATTSINVAEDAVFSAAPRPTITGRARVGSILTANPGTWSPTPAYAFQWNRSNIPIAGATAPTYKVLDADAGLKVSVTVTATKQGYRTQSSTSGDLGIWNGIIISSPVLKDTTLPNIPGRVYITDGSLTIPAGITLTLEPGVIVKTAGYINISGSLVAHGSSTQPVTFTTIEDDNPSLGGDTNMDGDATRPRTPFQSCCGMVFNVQSSGSIDFQSVNTFFSYRFESDNAKLFRIVDSRIDGQIIARRAPGAENANKDIEVRNNTIRWAYLIATNENNDARPMIISENTFLDNIWSSYLVRIYDVGLRPSNLQGNELSGSNRDIMQLQGTLVEDWSVQQQKLSFVLAGLKVASGVTLTFNAGQVMKFASGELEVQGRLLVNGTPTAPVTFTVLQDGSIGGRAYASAPRPTDYEGIRVASGGQAQLSHTNFRYARVALAVDVGGTADWFGGSVYLCAIGARGLGHLNALQINWGSPSGPAPYGSGTPVEGDNVNVKPWFGYYDPTLPTSPDGPHTCTTYTAFGLRGSANEPQGAYLSLFQGWSRPNFLNPDGTENPSIGFGDFNQKTLNAIIKRNEWGPADIRQEAIQYQAIPVPLFGDPEVTVFQFDQSVNDGAARLIARMKNELAWCDDAKFLIFGYSQGASAIHVALETLGREDPALLDRVSSVGLIGDASRSIPTQEDVWSSMQVSNGELSKTPLTLRQMGLMGAWPSGTGDFPSQVVDRITSLCFPKDLVCSFDLIGSNEPTHHTYADGEDRPEGGNLTGLAYEMAGMLPAT